MLLGSEQAVHLGAGGRLDGVQPGWKVLTTLSMLAVPGVDQRVQERTLLGRDADVLVELRPPLRGS